MNHQRIIKNLGTAELPGKQQRVPVGELGDCGIHADTEEPVHVDCIREGDVIRRIIVHCHCGKVISLLCEYDGECR